jgi:hypothetical protein
MAMPDTTAPLLRVIEVGGTLIGFLMIVVIFRVYRGLGGVVGASFQRLLFGAVLFTAAFVISAVIDWFNITTMENSMMLHMSIMTVAMILLVLSAIKSASLLK